jgi:membrane associated rhomboid family serine protease
MFFLPYRLDHAKNGIPFLTILVMCFCIFLFIDQTKSDREYHSNLISFCSGLSESERSLLRDLRDDDGHQYCRDIFEQIRSAEEPQAEVARLAQQAPVLKFFASPQDSYEYTLIQLEDMYGVFEREVPQSLTENIAYDPAEMDWFKMFSSTIAHGDLMHLLGNLVFFYIFSSAVELLVGSLLYFVFFLCATIATSLAYSYSMWGVQDALPTVGLSGVVMATLAALAILAPRARIRCFLWILVIFKRFTLPVMFLALWYVGWDLYDMNRQGMTSHINYVAHISGAATGALFALIIVSLQKHRGSRRLAV